MNIKFELKHMICYPNGERHIATPNKAFKNRVQANKAKRRIKEAIKIVGRHPDAYITAKPSASNCLFGELVADIKEAQR